MSVIGSASHSATVTVISLNISIEARLPTAFPVVASVIGNSGSSAGKKAEEGMAHRMNDNSSVPVPHNHISGLRPRDSQESLRSRKQVFGIRIAIGETGFFVDVVN